MIYYRKRNNFTLGSVIIQYASTNYKPQRFLDKTMEEAVKSSSIPEFKAKGTKIRVEATNKILDKFNQAISSIENSNV